METPEVLTTLVANCRSALQSDDPRREIHRLLNDFVADPEATAAAIPAFADDEVETSPRGFRLGGEHVAHEDPDLTVMVLDTLPGVVQPPHDHSMPAFIAVFEGAEEQRFWTRTAEGITPTPGRLLEAGQVLALGERGIHAISAPADTPARAVHVYLGDIYDIDRSIFHPDTLEEFPMSSERYDDYCRHA